MQQGTSQLTFPWSYVNSQKINLESYDNPRSVETWHEKIILRLKAKRVPNERERKKPQKPSHFPFFQTPTLCLFFSFCVSNGSDSFSFSSHKIQIWFRKCRFFSKPHLSKEQSIRHFRFMVTQWFKNFVHLPKIFLFSLSWTKQILFLN